MDEQEPKKCNWKLILIVTLALGGLAFAAGRFMTPTKVEKVEVVKEVVKWKERQSEDKDKVIIEVETVYPDGTRKIERKIVDKGKLRIDVEGESEKEKENTVVVENKKPDWMVSGLAGVGLKEKGLNGVYGAHVQRRVIGPVHVGGFGMTNGSGGLSVGISF